MLALLGSVTLLPGTLETTLFRTDASGLRGTEDMDTRFNLLPFKLWLIGVSECSSVCLMVEPGAECL